MSHIYTGMLFGTPHTDFANTQYRECGYLFWCNCQKTHLWITLILQLPIIVFANTHFRSYTIMPIFWYCIESPSIIYELLGRPLITLQLFFACVVIIWKVDRTLTPALLVSTRSLTGFFLIESVRKNAPTFFELVHISLAYP